MNMYNNVGYDENGVRVGNCNHCGSRGVAADQHCCPQCRTLIAKIAQATLFQYEDIHVLYHDWENDEIVDTIIKSALTWGVPVGVASVQYDNMFDDSMAQLRAIAELWIVILEGGWY